MKLRNVLQKTMLLTIMTLVVFATQNVWAQKSEENAPDLAPQEAQMPEPAAKPDLTGIETQLINSMANEKQFPQKTRFISDEDKSITQQKQNEQASPSAASQGLSLTRMILSTLLIVVVILGLAALWRFLQTKSLGFLPNNDKLKIVAQQMVSTRSKILVVEALGKNYLIGATQERIQLLADLDFFETVDQDAGEDSLEDVAAMSTLSPKGRDGTATEFEIPTSTAAEKLKEKLKNLKKLSNR